jgi:hypothetical protein
MMRKMLLLAMSVGLVLAFTVSAAQATAITDEEGNEVSSLTMTSEPLEIQTSAGKVVCNQVHTTAAAESGFPSHLFNSTTATSTVAPFSSFGECPIVNSEGIPVNGARVTTFEGETFLENGEGGGTGQLLLDTTAAPGVMAACTYAITKKTATYTTSSITTMVVMSLEKGPKPSCPATASDVELHYVTGHISIP